MVGNVFSGIAGRGSGGSRRPSRKSLAASQFRQHFGGLRTSIAAATSRQQRVWRGPSADLHPKAPEPDVRSETISETGGGAFPCVRGRPLQTGQERPTTTKRPLHPGMSACAELPGRRFLAEGHRDTPARPANRPRDSLEGDDGIGCRIASSSFPLPAPVHG